MTKKGVNAIANHIYTDNDNYWLTRIIIRYHLLIIISLIIIEENNNNNSYPSSFLLAQES